MLLDAAQSVLVDVQSRLMPAIRRKRRHALPAERGTLVVAGCEAHVCLLQTALGLRGARRAVIVVADACGSRAVGNRDAALARLARHGVDLMTTEMVVFEWLRDCEHPAFHDALAIVK